MIAAKDKEFFEDILAKLGLLNQLLIMMINDQKKRNDLKEFEFEFDLFKRSSSLIKSFDCIINNQNNARYNDIGFSRDN